MDKKQIIEVLADWQLPQGKDLLERIDKMVRPALLQGHFGRSFTRFISGSQYHLGGSQDTTELAELARVSSSDHVLDVCCFIGGPAVQLAWQFGCKVTGIDLSDNAIAAANRIAELAGLSSRATFLVANTSAMPFPDRSFTLVWSQGSLEHDEAWLKEFDRVLIPGGRAALTFQFRGRDSRDVGPFSRWSLADIVTLVQGMGYSVQHAQDITERDIEVGWKRLDRILQRDRSEFAEALGDSWVEEAHRQFLGEIKAMKAGRWGNGRLIATKLG